jgi:WD40 repeat protein
MKAIKYQAVLVAAVGGVLVVAASIVVTFLITNRQQEVPMVFTPERMIHTEDRVGVGVLAVSPGGEVVIAAPVGRFSRRVQGYDLRTGAAVPSDVVSDVPAQSIAVAPDGRTLVLGEYEGVLHILDFKSWTRRLSVVVGKGYVISLVFSPDSRYVYTGTTSGDGSIHRVDVNTGAVEVVVPPHSRMITPRADTISSLALSPDGKDIVIAAPLGAFAWNLSTGTERFVAHLGTECSCLSVAVSPDGTQMATLGGTVEIWDFRTGKRIRELKLAKMSASPFKVLFSPTGAYLAVMLSSAVEFPGQMVVWRVADYDSPIIFPCHTSTITDIAFIPRTNLLLTGSRDRTICVWDLDRLVTQDER